jgi:hypothetical protein
MSCCGPSQNLFADQNIDDHALQAQRPPQLSQIICRHNILNCHNYDNDANHRCCSDSSSNMSRASYVSMETADFHCLSDCCQSEEKHCNQYHLLQERGSFKKRSRLNSVSRLRSSDSERSRDSSTISINHSLSHRLQKQNSVTDIVANGYMSHGRRLESLEESEEAQFECPHEKDDAHQCHDCSFGDQEDDKGGLKDSTKHQLHMPSHFNVFKEPCFCVDLACTTD